MPLWQFQAVSDVKGMIMSLFQRIRSWLGKSETAVQPPAIAPKAVAAAPAPVSAASGAVDPAPAPVVEPVVVAKPVPVSPEVKALLVKGRSELKEENFAAAKATFDAVLAIAPENEAALKLANLSAARIKRDEALAKKAAAAAAKG